MITSMANTCAFFPQVYCRSFSSESVTRDQFCHNEVDLLTLTECSFSLLQKNREKVFPHSLKCNSEHALPAPVVHIFSSKRIK